MSGSLDGVVRESARRQVTMHRVTGGVWCLLGAMFSVAIFVPGKEGEDVMRVVCAIVGVVSLVGGVVFIRVMTRRIAVLVELLLSRRAELRTPCIIALRSRGTVIGHAITVRDASGRLYRMRVPSEPAAREMLANIPT